MALSGTARLHQFLPVVWRYYTYVNLVLVLASRLIYKHVNLLLSSMIVAVCSLAIFYWRPGYIKINTLDGGEYAIYDWRDYMYFDFVYHILPLLVVIAVYGNYYKKHKWSSGTWVAIGMICAFFAVFDPRKTYDLDNHTIAVLAAICASLYIAVV